MMKKIMLVIASLSISLSVYSADATVSELIKGMVIQESSKDNDYINIFFGESKENYCNIDVSKKSFEESSLIISKQKSTKNIKSGCKWDGKIYKESSEHDTYTTLKVGEVNNRLRTSKFTASLKLINLEFNEYFVLDDVDFAFINGKGLDFKGDNIEYYINNIQKLLTVTSELVTKYQNPSNLSFSNFAQYKKTKERELAPVCDYLQELYKSTGKLRGPHHGPLTQCRNVTLSMMVVLFDIRDKDRKSIFEQINKLENIKLLLTKELGGNR